MPEPQRTHDIAPQWIEQLAEGGRLIVPLLIHGYSRGIAFDKRGGRLVSRSLTVCGIVPMQGAGHRTAPVPPLRHEQIGVRFDDGEPPPPPCPTPSTPRGRSCGRG
ncbi:MAG: protein-L-isoaspartate(D-aspartate) O-methyltransferase [Streptomyces sp.]|jgi:protein-L-isoaspartate(D-aspartate) O-methyltransferase|nr:protein-L-isoaspartate(D-aspartate) O-methyltransferase [Streptomyces sp.]